jgi:hypothetical protein
MTGRARSDRAPTRAARGDVRAGRGPFERRLEQSGARFGHGLARGAPSPTRTARPSTSQSGAGWPLTDAHRASGLQANWLTHDEDVVENNKEKEK